MAAEQPSGAEQDGTIDELRTRLASRLTTCFDRLDDAVSELVALHSVDEEDIVARVKATIVAEQQ